MLFLILLAKIKYGISRTPWPQPSTFLRREQGEMQTVLKTLVYVILQFLGDLK